MKKTLHIGTISKLHKEIPSANGQVVLSRSGNKVWMQNMEIVPREKVSFELDEERHELLIRVSFRDGDCISIKDTKGVVDKEFVID